MTRNQLLLELLTLAPGLPPAADPAAALLQAARARCPDPARTQHVCQLLQDEGLLSLQAGRWVPSARGQEVLTLNHSPSQFAWVRPGSPDTEDDELARWVGVLNQLGAALDRTGPEERRGPEYAARQQVWLALARNGPYTGD